MARTVGSQTVTLRPDIIDLLDRIIARDPFLKSRPDVIYRALEEWLPSWEARRGKVTAPELPD